MLLACGCSISAALVIMNRPLRAAMATMLNVRLPHGCTYTEAPRTNSRAPGPEPHTQFPPIYNSRDNPVGASDKTRDTWAFTIVPRVTRHAALLP